MMKKDSRRLLAFAVAAVLAGAHIVGRHPDVAGLPLVADHLFTIGAVLVLLAIATAAGRLILRRSQIELASPLDSVLFGAATGLGAIATALLLCGALRVLHPVVVVAMVAAVAVPARRDIAALPTLLREAAREARALAGTPVLAVSGLIAAAMLLQALAPPTDYDSLMYHVELPARFLARHSVHMPEANPMHVAAVGLAHLLYVPLLAIDSPAGPAVLSVAIAIGFAFALVSIARVALAETGSRWTLLALWGSPIIALVAMTPKVDVTLAFFLTLAHLALLLAWSRREQGRPHMLLAALMLGFGLGVKYLALPFALALAPLALAVAWRSGRAGRDRIRMIAVPLFGFLLAAAPWLLKNQALLGAPLYPYLAERVPAPWLASLYEGGRFPAGIDSVSVRPLRAVRESFNVADWFTAPERLTPESEAGFYRANPLFVLAPVALLFARNGAVAWIVLPAALYFAALLAIGSSINLRYLIPAIGPLTLLSAQVLAAAAQRMGGTHTRRVVMVAIGIVTVTASARAIRHRPFGTGAIAHAFGFSSRDEYRQWSRDDEIRSYSQLTEAVNGAVPADGRVLLLFEGRGYYFAPSVIQDNVLTNWVYLQPVVESRCLDGSGITHLLVGTGTLEYFRRRGLDERLIRWDRFPGFAARCLEPLSRTPAFELYRVR